MPAITWAVQATVTSLFRITKQSYSELSFSRCGTAAFLRGFFLDFLNYCLCTLFSILAFTGLLILVHMWRLGSGEVDWELELLHYIQVGPLSVGWLWTKELLGPLGSISQLVQLRPTNLDMHLLSLPRIPHGYMDKTNRRS